MLLLTFPTLQMMFSSVFADFCHYSYEVTNSCDFTYGNVLKMLDDVRSLTECCTKCSENDRCLSVMYARLNRECQLNSERHPSLDTDCSSQLRYATLTKNSCHKLINQDCSDSTQCAVTNSLCAAGTCQCDQGFYYNYVDETCTSTCATYGSDYTTIKDHVLVVTSLIEFTGISVSDCKDQCSSIDECMSFNFASSHDNLCTLKSVADSPTYNPGIDHYVRNCS